MEAPSMKRIIEWLPEVGERASDRLHISFDEEADVLYIVFEEGVAADRSVTMDNDVVHRFAAGRLIGMTVLHATHRAPDGSVLAVGDA